MRTPASVAAPLALAIVLASQGCSSLSKSSRRGDTLSPADFRAADAGTIEPAAMSSRRPAPSYPEQEMGDPGTRITVLEGAPAIESGVPQPPAGPAMMMDALIGDINGTPLYATQFFAPIDARLAGLAAKLRGKPDAWTAEARKIIGTQLGDMVRDELLLAEARAALSPEQKQGLLTFIEQVRKDLVSRGGGGQAAVDEQLREQGEKGLDAKLKENIDRQLIYANLREKVLPRASVSWHEVEVEYERRQEQFNPDPTATFRVVWLPADKQELVDEFSSQLARGVSFDELAEREENEFPDEGVLKVKFKGELSKAAIFGPREMNEAAQKLRPGEVTGPFKYRDYMCWLTLSEIEQPRAMSIYEAQLSIYNELRERKVKIESEKYLSNLLDKQSASKLNEMGDKLLAMATQRYFLATP